MAGCFTRGSARRNINYCIFKSEMDIKELEKNLKKEYFCLNEDNSIGNVLVNNNILFTRNIREITLKNEEKEYIFAIENENISPVDEDWNYSDEDLLDGEGIFFNGKKISSATYEFEFCVYEKENDIKREKQRIKLIKYVKTVKVSAQLCKKRYKAAKEAQTRNISFIRWRKIQKKIVKVDAFIQHCH